MTTPRPRTESIKRGMFWLAVFGMGGCGIATLAAFGGRIGWLWELSSHFRLHFALALIASAGVLAWLGYRKLALAGAVLAAVNVAVIAPMYSGPPRVPAPPNALRAMSINLYWKSRAHGPFIELVRRENPDFLIIMEITDRWVEALSAIETEYPYRKELPRRDSSGIAFYSRWPIESLDVEFLAHMPTIVARFHVHEQPLTLLAVHVASPGTSRHFSLRNRQLTALAELAREQTGPLMLMGDLNMTGWSVYFQDLLDRTGLTDSQPGFGIQGTWPRFAPGPIKIPIDHCLTSDGILVHDRRVVHVPGSDHRGLVVDFSIR